MKTIALIHFQPLEKYPPVTNIITEFSNVITCDQRLFVLTNNGGNNTSNFFSDHPYITIKRLSEVCREKPRLIRLWNYIKFYLHAFHLLWKIKPHRIVYFETLSAFPALVYHSLFPETEIGVHYHEYSSQGVYKKGMLLERLGHWLEKIEFPRFKWISQTNLFRLAIFLQEHRQIPTEVGRIMPNYPPKSWERNRRTLQVHGTVKVVYIGALSKDNMYLEEFCKWVCGHNGGITLDIYSSNFQQSARDLIDEMGSPYITFRGQTSYPALPTILENYHAGVILYKGQTENHRYSVPNKLFEYHTCGLDVWFPDTISASLPYVTKGTFPKITALNFERLDTVDLAELVNRDNNVLKPNTLSCEEGIAEFRDFVLNK